jgi:hypothetical protein
MILLDLPNSNRYKTLSLKLFRSFLMLARRNLHSFALVIFLAFPFIAVASINKLFGPLSIEQPATSTSTQKWTYVLLTIKEQPTGKVTKAETFETLGDLQSYVVNVKPAPNCPCGEDCTCVDCKCEQRKPVKPSTKLPQVSADEEINEARGNIGPK